MYSRLSSPAHYSRKSHHGTKPPFLSQNYRRPTRTPFHRPLLHPRNPLFAPSHNRLLSISTILLPPLVFTTLLISLWLYKSLALILFQSRIIYMPSIPPFSRSEAISDYASQCRSVSWREGRIRASDGVELATAVGTLQSNHDDDRNARAGAKKKTRKVVIAYFQGNGSSLPPRLPSLSSILISLPSILSNPSVTYTIHALSYRGYWTSRGRPSQPGIERDATAFLAHIAATNPSDTRIVLWGQSLGTSVAVHAAAAQGARVGTNGKEVNIAALILETPFTSIERMLHTVYPQPWLPYRYLAPFLWNHWDTASALTSLSRQSSMGNGGEPKPPPRILILQASSDELVPRSHGEELEGLCERLGMRVERVVVGGALHVGCMGKKVGREAVVGLVREVGEDSKGFGEDGGMG